MSVSTDRWTCPSCNRTVVVDGSDADVKCCIAAAQRRHGRAHQAATAVLTHVGLADAHDPPRRRGGRGGRNQARSRS